MFGFGDKLRGKKGLVAEDKDIWNGWSQRLVESINGAGRFNIKLTGMTVTSSFISASRSVVSQVLAASNPEGSYLEVDVELFGNLERRRGIKCDMGLVRVAKSQVVKEQRAGFLALTSSDPVEGYPKDPAHEWRTATLVMKLYDVDGLVTQSLQQAFNAARFNNTMPELRVFLADKVQLTVDGLNEQLERSVNISWFIIWEKWGKMINAGSSQLGARENQPGKGLLPT
jgi:hypothetical protein